MTAVKYNNPMKKIANYKIAVALLFLPLLLCACNGKNVPLEANQTDTPVPEMAAAPEVVATPEPVISYTDPEALTILPEEMEVPSGYTHIPEGKDSVFGFIDQDGTIEYRTAGYYQELRDGAPSQSFYGFYPSDADGNLLSDQPSDPESEHYGICTPFEIVAEEQRPRKKYQLTDRTGLIQSNDPEHPGYYLYGAFGDEEPSFYPALEDGTMIPGAFPITFDITVPGYTPVEEPENDGDLWLVIYIGSESVVAYRAQDGEWIPERIMICSTGRKKGATPVGDHNIMKQYLYKKLGMNGEGYYGQYSSRIAGHVLFHSVPIDGKNNQKQEIGKKQMKTKYYENLGKPVSGGCVRLRVIDAYWIYTHATVGTPVRVTLDDGPEPEQPVPLIYEEPYVNKKGDLGWDPSDPDPENPYHAIYPPELILNGPVIDKSKDSD